MVVRRVQLRSNSRSEQLMATYPFVCFQIEQALVHTNFLLMSDKTIKYWDTKLDIDRGLPDTACNCMLYMLTICYTG